MFDGTGLDLSKVDGNEALITFLMLWVVFVIIPMIVIKVGVIVARLAERNHVLHEDK